MQIRWVHNYELKCCWCKPKPSGLKTPEHPNLQKPHGSCDEMNQPQDSILNTEAPASMQDITPKGSFNAMSTTQTILSEIPP